MISTLLAACPSSSHFLTSTILGPDRENCHILNKTQLILIEYSSVLKAHLCHKMCFLFSFYTFTNGSSCALRESLFTSAD